MILPNDATPVEREIYSIMLRRVFDPKSSLSVYAKLDNPEDMFVLAHHFELKNNTEDTAAILRITRKALYSRIQRIKNIIKGNSKTTQKKYKSWKIRYDKGHKANGGDTNTSPEQ